MAHASPDAATWCGRDRSWPGPTSPRHAPTDRFRVVGGHTDSPNLRLKQHHDVDTDAAAVVALEPYGGPLLHTWFDRDLGVAGRLVLRDGTEQLVRVDEPVLRVPHLAIHLDEDRKGSDIDPQRHLNAIWGVEPREFLPWLCKREGLTAPTSSASS